MSIKIGPKERQILLKLVEGEFVPPSVYLGDDYGRCPAGQTLKRLVFDKKLAVMQFMTWTPAECLQRYGQTRPGRETAEINAALRPTEAGLQVIARLRAEDRSQA